MGGCGATALFLTGKCADGERGDDVTLFQRAGGAAECGAPDLGDRGEGRLAGPSAQSMTRARPTSRGRARCVLLRFGAARGQTAASPRAGACRLRCVGRRCLALRGKGRCGGAGATLFAPAGQRRCGMGAPDFGWFMGKAVCGRVCPSKRAAGAPGRGGELRRRAFHEAAEFPSPSRGENAGC